MNRATPILLLLAILLLCRPGSAAATEADTFSPVVSYQYHNALDDSPATSPIVSPVVSYQYFEWPGDENAAVTSSANVSYYFYTNAPVITQQPQDQWPKIGANVTLSVQAGGAAPLAYHWYWNSVSLPNTNSPAIWLNNVQSTDAGFYSVVVSNAYDQVTSTSAKVSIHNGPLTAKPAAPPLNRTAQPLPASLATKRTTPVSTQLRWFNPATHQFEAVPQPFPSGRKTVVITHGWNDGVESEHQVELADPNNPGWIKSMAQALSSNQTYGNSLNVLAWDWGPVATLTDQTDPITGFILHWDPAIVAPSIIPQGGALGAALMDLLGPSYSQPIHFIGHSFGTGVNCKAADYIHGNWRPIGDVRPSTPRFDFNKTQMTLLDEAELASIVKGMHVLGDAIIGLWDKAAINDEVQQIQDFYIKVIPDHYRWIDNYVSEVGFLHKEAANTMLYRHYYLPNFVAPHGYACVWYTKTIAAPDSSPLMGHRYSFEWNSLDSAPLPPSYYVQSVAQGSLETELIKTNSILGEAVSFDRFLIYPTKKIGEALTAATNYVLDAGAAAEAATYRALTATGNAVLSAEVSAVNYAGNLLYDTYESFFAARGKPAFSSGVANTTASTIQPIGTSPAPSASQSWWDGRYILSAGGSPSPQITGTQTLDSTAFPSASAASAPASLTGDATNAAFMTLASHVPLEAVGITFEYQMTNAAPDNFMTMGIGADNYFSLEASYALSGTWNASPMFQISDLRGQNVQLTFAFLGTNGAPTGTLGIRNIQFYIPPRPKLELQIAGPQLNTSWPISALDWTLESTTDLANPNGWQPMNTAPLDADYFHTQTFDISTTGKAFFRLRK